MSLQGERNARRTHRPDARLHVGLHPLNDRVSNRGEADIRVVVLAKEQESVQLSRVGRDRGPTLFCLLSLGAP